METFSYNTFLICLAFSIVLMVLFVLINIPFYRNSYGVNTNKFVIRTIFLNSLVIIIAWSPVVYFWPEFSIKFLLPAICIIGALGCVGSRFIYNEIIPDELAKRLIELIQNKSKTE